MKPSLLLILGLLGFSVPIAPPDSLTSKVVIFKNSRDLRIGTDISWETPQATGFFLDSGDVKRAFIVTARHVIRAADSVAGLHLHAVESSGRTYDEYLGDYRLSSHVVTHPDFWVDIAILDNRSQVDRRNALSGFRIEDIATPEELQRIEPGSSAFYIGMCLDSVRSATNVYAFPEGAWLETYDPGRLVIDTTRELVWKADFALKIPGTPGVSGSPVLVKAGASYKLVGIVNGFGVDASGNMVDTAYCTAAYRIIEALADTNRGRWISRGREWRMGNRG